MLIFYNNFFSACPDILFDNEQNKGYLLIQKCGTQSLLNLTKTQPHRFSAITIDKLCITEVIVFIRDPIERFFSGLETQMNLYQFDATAIDKLINRDNFIPIIDSHTIPQFWFLLRSGLENNIRFTFKDISTLHEVDPTILNLNRNSKNKFNLTDSTRNKVSHFFTEDIVMYNQFLNTTTTLDVIINAIKQEKDFISDIEQYKKVINYLF